MVPRATVWAGCGPAPCVLQPHGKSHREMWGVCASYPHTSASTSMARTKIETRRSRVVDVTIQSKPTARGRRNQIVPVSPKQATEPGTPHSGTGRSGGRRSRTHDPFQRSEPPIPELVETVFSGPPQVAHLAVGKHLGTYSIHSVDPTSHAPRMDTTSGNLPEVCVC